MSGGWLKTGAQSAHLQQVDLEDFEQRKKERMLPFRFFLKDQESTEITFIDGDLDKDGNLTPPRFFEHTIQFQGRLQHFICPKKTDPQTHTDCPICNTGDRPALVAIFTIIDHNEYQNQDTGEIYKDRVRLLAAKPNAFDLIAHAAKINGGLACARFRVSRIGPKSSGIGDTFEFLGKEERQKLRNTYYRVIEPTQEEITNAELEGIPAPRATRATNFEAVNYGEDIPFYDAAQLANLGVGQLSAVHGGGGNGASRFNNGGAFQNKKYVPPSQQDVAEDGVNYDAHL